MTDEKTARCHIRTAGWYFVEFRDGMAIYEYRAETNEAVIRLDGERDEEATR